MSTKIKPGNSENNHELKIISCPKKLHLPEENIYAIVTKTVRNRCRNILNVENTFLTSVPGQIRTGTINYGKEKRLD